MTDIRPIADALREWEAACLDMHRMWTPEMEEWSEKVRRQERSDAVRALFPAHQSESDFLQMALRKAAEAGIPFVDSKPRKGER